MKILLQSLSSTTGSFGRQGNLLPQSLAVSFILIRSCSNIVAIEIVDDPTLKEMTICPCFLEDDTL